MESEGIVDTCRESRRALFPNLEVSSSRYNHVGNVLEWVPPSESKVTLFFKAHSIKVKRIFTSPVPLLFLKRVMLPNQRPWSSFPSQNLQYPYYYSGTFHTIYNSASNVPPSVPYGPGRGSLRVATPLPANAREFAPAETVGPTPETPSSGFPPPQRSSVVNVSNPIKSKAVVWRPSDPANAAEAAGLQRSTPPESPLSKKERKRVAGSSVGENEEQERAEGVERVRRWLEEKGKKMQKVEDAGRLRMAEAEGVERVRMWLEGGGKKIQEVEDAARLRVAEKERKREQEKTPPAVAGPAPVTPSSGFPLRQRSPTIKISNLDTEELAVMRLPVPVTVAGAAGVGGFIQLERPPTKEERKMKAKLRAEEMKRAERIKAAQKDHTLSEVKICSQGT